MPFVAVGRTSWSLGALIAFFVLVAAFILAITGTAVTPFNLLIMVGALALALLIG